MLLQLVRNVENKNIKIHIYIKKVKLLNTQGHVSIWSLHVALPHAALLSCAELYLDSDWGWPDGAEKQIHLIWPQGSKERKEESLWLHINKKSPVFFPCPAVQCDMRWPAAGFGSERKHYFTSRTWIESVWLTLQVPPPSISLCTSPDCSPPSWADATAALWRECQCPLVAPQPRSRCPTGGRRSGRRRSRSPPAGWGSRVTSFAPGCLWMGSGRGFPPGWRRYGSTTPWRELWAAVSGQMTAFPLSVGIKKTKNTSVSEAQISFAVSYRGAYSEDRVVINIHEEKENRPHWCYLGEISLVL